MKPSEENNVETKVQENDDYTFLQEKINERPINRRKLFKNTVTTLGMAVIFGLVACVTFILLEPVLGNLISKEEKKPVVVLPSEEDEVRPEDMVWVDEDLEDKSEEPETNISNAVTTVELQISDYQLLYNKLGGVAAEVRKSMVVVTARTSNLDWFSDYSQKQKQSSGIIVADNETEYLIFCNYDEIIKSSGIFVTFSDGTEVEAKLKSYDKTVRKAIVAVEMAAVPDQTKEAITYAKLGSSNVGCEPGTVVLAIGSPMGNIDSVGYGIITSSGNKISSIDSNYCLITTDIYGSQTASGVLVNMKGRVIGFIDQNYNTADLKNQLSALGVSELRKKIEGLSNETPIPYLGIRVTDVTKGAQEQLNVPQGAFIMETVMNSPAMMVGLRKGDVVTAINDVVIENAADYENELLSYAPDEEITVSVMRINATGYSEVNVKVTLQELK